MTYSVSLHLCKAHAPRTPGSTILPDDRMDVVYRKYTATAPTAPTLNLLFIHGTGMNKAVWHYHIQRLFEQQGAWQIGTAVSVDVVNHGDLAVLNRTKLGPGFTWIDAAKDLLAVVEAEQLAARPLVAVGHSLGGGLCVLAASMSPRLFDLVVLADPVMSPETYRMPRDQLGKYVQFRRATYKRMRANLTDRFASVAAGKEWFATNSIYRGCDARLLADIADDEVVEQTDGTAIAKSPVDQQMLVYNDRVYGGVMAYAAAQALTCEVLYVPRTKASTGLPLELVELIAKAINHVTVEPIPGTGHMCHMEQPDAMVERLVRWLDRRAEAPRPEQPVHGVSPEERAQLLAQAQRDAKL